MSDRENKLVRTQSDGDAEIVRRHRYPRWSRVAALALVAAVTFWAIGREASRHIEAHDIETASRRQPPVPGYPPTTPTADNNNTIMRMGLVGDLDGMAVAYTIEADRLVSDGAFLTDFSLHELASILHISEESLADPAAPGEIDSDAELFRAQSGTLTDRAKDLSRKHRMRQVRDGKTPDMVTCEWVITNFSFTLRRLKHPNDQEKVVLSAIILAAAETMPMPGDKIRAVGVNRGDLAYGLIALSAGMLPLEAPHLRFYGPLSRPRTQGPS
jgi:hypothetical protein